MNVEKYQRNFQPCPKCGTPKNRGAKTCAACAGKGRGTLSRKQLVTKVCRYCKEIFRIPLWRANQNRGIFCSRECKDKYLSTLTGGNSIRWRGGTAGHRRGIGWKVAREWALVMANNRCEICGQVNSGLNVHHSKPYKKCKDAIEANSFKNLIVLCDSCHMKVEATGKIPARKGGDVKGEQYIKVQS